jgi:cell division septal protein FtsQ
MKKFLIFIFLIILFVSTIILFLNKRVTNIYITNNVLLKDQEILDLFTKYPLFVTSEKEIMKTLRKNKYIKNIVLKKELPSTFYIEIEENKPLLYYTSEEKTVLLDGSYDDKKFDVPTMINYVPDLTFKKFISEYGKLDSLVTKRISEIKYEPSIYDDERFLLYMNDGNYIYANITRLSLVDKYLDIVKSLGDKKGILNLDSGSYFEVFED